MDRLDRYRDPHEESMTHHHPVYAFVDRRYRTIFENSPISLWDKDFSLIKERIDDLKRSGVSDFRGYLESHPHVLRHYVDILRINDVNEATVRLYRARNKNDFLTNIHRVFCEETYDLFREEIIAIAEGNLDLEAEGITRRFDGQKNYIYIKWAVPESARETLSSVIVSVIDTTERHRLEQALRDSHELYRARFEESPISLWDKDYSRIKQYLDKLRREKGITDFKRYFEEHPEELHYCATLIRVTDVNKTTVEMFGAKDKEDFKKNLHRIFCKETWECFKQEVLYVADKRSRRESETCTLRFDGKKNYIAVRWSLPKGFPDDYSRMLFSVMDITRLKEVEDRLINEKDFSEAIINALPGCFFLIDMDLRLKRWNRHLEHITGFSAEDLSEMDVLHICSPDERTKISTELQGIPDHGRVSFEVSVVNRDGVSHPHLFTCTGVVLNNRHYLVGTGIDITDRIIVEEALKESEEVYRTTFRNAGIGIAHITDDGRYLRVNNKLLDILGYSEEDLLNISFMDTIHPEDLQYCMRQFNDVVAGRRDRIFCEKRYLRKDGGVVWATTTATALRDTNGRLRYLITLIDDITEKKRLEEEAKIIQAKLIHTNKMTALGTLVSGIAHEINNPNAYIMNNARIFIDIWRDISRILREYQSEKGSVSIAGLSLDELIQYMPGLLEGIREGAERINDIVSNLKTYSRPERATLDEEVDLNAVLKSAVLFLDATIKKTTDNFSVSFNRDIPPVKGSARQIEQVVMNLIMNALQAIESRSSAVRISLHYEPGEDSVKIVIEDEGRGIPAEIMDRIFEPFFTTKIKEGGTGLGLAISHAIIRDHGGEIEFESTPNCGTRVAVSLPVYK